MPCWPRRAGWHRTMRTSRRPWRGRASGRPAPPAPGPPRPSPRARPGAPVPPGPVASRAFAAVAAARAEHDVLLESAALDAAIGSAVYAGNMVEAHRLADERVARLAPCQDDPMAGLELKDALHVATFCA